MTSTPLIAPIAAPIRRSSGTAAQPEPSPCGKNLWMRTTLQKITSGPTDRSSPPPPDRIEGVDAIATIASGANEASSCGQLDGLPKLGSATMLATRSASDSSSAKPNGRLRRKSRIGALPEEGGHERLPRELGALELAEDRVLAEDDHAVHQLHVLVDL